VKLNSRRGHDWTTKLPHVATTAGRVMSKQALLDGEAAVLLPSGKTSFHSLQEALSGSEEGRRFEPAYFVFDLLFLDGKDMRTIGTEERKAKLRYSDHDLGQGPTPKTLHGGAPFPPKVR